MPYVIERLGGQVVRFHLMFPSKCPNCGNELTTPLPDVCPKCKYKLTISDKKELNEMSKLNNRRELIIPKIDSSINYRNIVIAQIDNMQKELGEVKPIIAEDIKRLNSIRQILGNDEAYYREYNPAIEGTQATLERLSNYDTKNAQNWVNLARKMGLDSELFTRAVFMGSGTIPSMATNAASLSYGMENREAIQSHIKVLTEPSAPDRQKMLSSELTVINPRLSVKLNGAWETLYDRSKQDRFLQAASSARDLISDLLEIMAPDCEVKAMDWFIPNPQTKGRPTQKQRARFAILGKNKTIREEELRTIYELEDSIRESYEKLSPIVHLRKYEEDLQRQTESLIDQCQIYLLQLLTLREKYFETI